MKLIKKYYNLIFIAAILFFRGFYLANGWGLGHKAGDSGSYLNTDLHFSELGRRVPLYPIFLKICKRMVKWDVNMGCAVAAIIQCLISIIMLYFLYSVLMTVTKRRLLSWIILLFYGCNVALLNWDSAIMTESFSIDAVIMFVYLILKYLEKRTALWGVLTIIQSVVAAMIKPTLAVLTGVCLVLLIIQYVSDKELRKTVLKAAIALALAILYYLAYCSITYRNYGVFNLTQLAPRHGLVTCLVTGTYKNYTDKELVAQIDEVLERNRAKGLNIKRYETTTEVMKLFGGYKDNRRACNMAVAKFNKYCASTDRLAHIRFKLENIVKYWDTPYENVGWTLWEDAIEYSRFERAVYCIQKYLFSTLYIWCDFVMLLVSLVFTVTKCVKNREIPWHWLGMTGTMLILLFIVYNNAYASFYRHTLFLVPFVYITLAMTISEIVGRTGGRG